MHDNRHTQIVERPIVERQQTIDSNDVASRRAPCATAYNKNCRYFA
jgi:hypothetical protein